MKKALAVSGHYPCVRAGKMTEAMNGHGWSHDAVCRGLPPQFLGEYGTVTAIPWALQGDIGRAIRASDASLIHVHNEPNWPVTIAKDNALGRPVVMSVHDVTSARPGVYDPYEREAYEAADAFVFVSDGQRDFCLKSGFAVEGKPWVAIGNFESASFVVEKQLLPKIGGVVYMGGADPRGAEGAWRDLSPVADALEPIGGLHILPGNPSIDYGHVHKMVMDAPALNHRISQFSWGFTGTPQRCDAWSHSLPNKFYSYICSGVPFIAMNNDLLKPYAKAGLGIYCDDLGDVVKAAQQDPKPYRKRVMREQYRFTFAYNIGPVVEMFDGLVS